MADYLVTDTELTSVANAIRTKRGLPVTNKMAFPNGFVSSIGNAHISWQQIEVVKFVDQDMTVTSKVRLWRIFGQDEFTGWLTGSTDPVIVDRIYAPDIAPIVLMRPYYYDTAFEVALFFYQSNGATASVPQGTEVYFTYRRPIIA